MVKGCLNTNCQEEFRVLNAGDLYALEARSADTEFFWLCANCALRYDVALDAMGRVALRPRGKAPSQQPPDLDGHLRLIARSLRPTPRPDAIPSGERTVTFLFNAGSVSSPPRLRGFLADCVDDFHCG
jgi:hypothetical protein